MKRFLSLFVMFLLFWVCTSNSYANATQPTENDMHKTYFIAFHSKTDSNLVKANGGKVKREYKYIPVVAAKLPEKAVQALAKNPKIAYIEEDASVTTTNLAMPIIEAEATTITATQEIPWGVSHIGATSVQQNGYLGTGVKIGVLDTGIDYNHKDLKVSGGISFVQGTTDFFDDNGHGTHVAGTISALNNSLGVVGVAPQANLYAIKVLDQSGDGSYSDIIAGIEWAISNNLDIINMSLGGTKPSKTLNIAVDKAYNNGMILVASAGNLGVGKKDTITYPAAFDSVIAVGAVDELNKRAIFSSTGKQLNIMAPGVVIYSTVPGGYGYESGTSMAAPHVTGAAALVKESNPGLSNVQLRKLLTDTSIQLGESSLYGSGLVDVMNAVGK
jgi:subtilisin